MNKEFVARRGIVIESITGGDESDFLVINDDGLVKCRTGVTMSVPIYVEDPLVSDEGDIYFNSTDKIFLGYNGTVWEQIGGIKKGFKTVVKNVDDVFAVDLVDHLNFLLNCSGDYSIEVTVNVKNVGQTGAIIINNTSITNPSLLPSNLKTPNGDNIDWVTENGRISLISYIVIDIDTVLVNYVGNFQ